MSTPSSPTGSMTSWTPDRCRASGTVMAAKPSSPAAPAPGQVSAPAARSGQHILKIAGQEKVAAEDSRIHRCEVDRRDVAHCPTTERQFGSIERAK